MTPERLPPAQRTSGRWDRQAPRRARGASGRRHGHASQRREHLAGAGSEPLRPQRLDPAEQGRCFRHPRAGHATHDRRNLFIGNGIEASEPVPRRLGSRGGGLPERLDRRLLALLGGVVGDLEDVEGRIGGRGRSRHGELEGTARLGPPIAAARRTLTCAQAGGWTRGNGRKSLQSPARIPEGVGFEPTVGGAHDGFQDRSLRPLGQPSGTRARSGYSSPGETVSSTVSSTKIGVSSCTARAIASLGRASTSTGSSPRAGRSTRRA